MAIKSSLPANPTNATHHAPPFNNDRLTRPQAADYIGLKVSTLESDACTRKLGIPFYRIGGRIAYRRSDLDAWLETRRVGGTL